MFFDIVAAVLLAYFLYLSFICYLSVCVFNGIYCNNRERDKCSTISSLNLSAFSTICVFLTIVMTKVCLYICIYAYVCISMRIYTCTHTYTFNIYKYLCIMYVYLIALCSVKIGISNLHYSAFVLFICILFWVF